MCKQATVQQPLLGNGSVDTLFPLQRKKVFCAADGGANIQLILHKTFIRSIMTYACPAWEFAADS
jgi:hypothetical protein